MNLPRVELKVERSVSYEYQKRRDVLKVRESKSIGITPVVNLSTADSVTVNAVTLRSAISSRQQSDAHFGWSTRSKRQKILIEGGISLLQDHPASGKGILMVDATKSTINGINGKRHSASQAAASSTQYVARKRGRVIGKTGSSQFSQIASLPRKRREERLASLRLSARRPADQPETVQSDEIWRLISEQLRVVCCEEREDNSHAASPIALSETNTRGSAKRYVFPNSKDRSRSAQTDSATCDEQLMETMSHCPSSKLLVVSQAKPNDASRVSGTTCMSASPAPGRSANPQRNVSADQNQSASKFVSSFGAISLSKPPFPILSSRERGDRDEMRRLRKRFHDNPLEYLSAAYGPGTTVQREDLPRINASVERHRAGRRPGVLARLEFFERVGERISTLRERDRVEASEPRSGRVRTSSGDFQSQKVDAVCSSRSSRNPSESFERTAPHYPPALAGSALPVRDCIVSVCSMPMGLHTKRIRLARCDSVNWRSEKLCWHPKLLVDQFKMPTQPQQSKAKPGKTQSQLTDSRSSGEAPTTRNTGRSTANRTDVRLVKSSRTYSQLTRASPRRICVRSPHSV